MEAPPHAAAETIVDLLREARGSPADAPPRLAVLRGERGRPAPEITLTVAGHDAPAEATGRAAAPAGEAAAARRERRRSPSPRRARMAAATGAG